MGNMFTNENKKREVFWPNFSVETIGGGGKGCSLYLPTSLDLLRLAWKRDACT